MAPTRINGPWWTIDPGWSHQSGQNSEPLVSVGASNWDKTLPPPYPFLPPPARAIQLICSCCSWLGWGEFKLICEGFWFPLLSNCSKGYKLDPLILHCLCSSFHGLEIEKFELFRLAKHWSLSTSFVPVFQTSMFQKFMCFSFLCFNTTFISLSYVLFNSSILHSYVPNRLLTCSKCCWMKGRRSP